MNELLTKISSYNLFNYLLPGVIFAVLAGDTFRFPILQRDLISAGFLCYFVGLVISRFGSLVVEPILKRLSFIKFSDYRDFVTASKEDNQIAVLSEANNTYRTFSSLFILLLLLRIYAKVEGKIRSLKGWDAAILILLLLVMFLFSYRKQTSYVSKRVKAAGAGRLQI
jgi:hypothetical protein